MAEANFRRFHGFPADSRRLSIRFDRFSSEPLVWGRQKGVTPISSDFPVFFRFVPICAPCFREYPDLFRFAPFSDDWFRFVFRTNQNKSGKPLSADPFLQIPDFCHFQSVSVSFNQS